MYRMMLSCDPEYKKAFDRVYRLITSECSPTTSGVSSSGSGSLAVSAKSLSGPGDPSISKALSSDLNNPLASEALSSGTDITAVIDSDPDILAALYESGMKTGDRKSSGTYYTSHEVVSFMCRDVLAHYLSNHIGLSHDDIYDAMKTEAKIDPGIAAKADRALESIRILDPAAGCGAFVTGMLDEIVRLRTLLQAKKHPFQLMYNAVINSIHGADIDPIAVEITKLRLQYRLMRGYEQYIQDTAASGRDFPEMPGSDNFKCSIVCVDSLLEYDNYGFDAIISNPPYISAVEASRSGRERRQALKQKYPQLKGAFDIYTAFLIDGIYRTNEKGVFCWIVPNKLLVSQYAAPVLEYLKNNGLMYSISVSDIGVFSKVGVYPVIISGNKHYAANSFTEYTADSLRNLANRCFAEKREMKSYKTFADHGIKIASGAAGFQAKQLQQYLREGTDVAEDKEQQRSHCHTSRNICHTSQDICRTGHNIIPFAVSGAIDKYRLKRSKIRYMGTTYREPFIIKGDKVAESKWDLWCSKKICIAGLTREIEAYYSREPLALGVGAYAIYDFGGFEPLYLLALLNSKFMSWYLREKFHERHLSGDYLAINKFTLEQLPLVKADKAVQEKIAQKAEKLLALYRTGVIDNEAVTLLNEIDETVYKLYELDSKEIDMIQSCNIRRQLRSLSVCGHIALYEGS